MLFLSATTMFTSAGNQGTICQGIIEKRLCCQRSLVFNIHFHKKQLPYGQSHRKTFITYFSNVKFVPVQNLYF